MLAPFNKIAPSGAFLIKGVVCQGYLNIYGMAVVRYKQDEELDDLPTPYKFDVIDYNSLEHEGMKNSIDRDGKIFYERYQSLKLTKEEC